MSLVTIPAAPAALTVRELTAADHTLWNQFVAAQPGGDVLQSWEWGDVKSPEWTPLRIAVFREGQIIAGVALLRRPQPLIGEYFYATRGPLLVDWADESVFTALLGGVRDHAKRLGAKFFKIDPAVTIDHPEVDSLFRRHGFAPTVSSDAQGFGGIQPRCVMQLSLAGRSLEQIKAGFKPQTRRNIKLALEKHGVEVLTETTRDDLAIFHQLYVTTAQRDGFQPYHLGYLQKLWDALVPVGMAKLFLTRYEGTYLSGAICFRIGDKCWYVFGASSNAHRNVMPNYAMQWAMISWAKSLDCASYDFRGVSPRRRQEGEEAADVEKEDHLQGLNRFKEGFGAEYVEYLGEYDLVYSPQAYWLFTRARPAARSFLRRLRGR